MIFTAIMNINIATNVHDVMNNPIPMLFILKLTLGFMIMVSVIDSNDSTPLGITIIITPASSEHMMM
jgi:hypothetical protein